MICLSVVTLNYEGSNQDWDMNYKICENEINNKTE